MPAILALLLFFTSLHTSIYDEERVAELITVITSTNPIPSMPSTHFLYEAQKSLFLIPALARCKKIIVFDGIHPDRKKQAPAYLQYKKRVEELVATDPYFANTELLFCEKWGHLSGAMRKAIELVKTPYVFIHQHDLVLTRSFDFSGVISSMEANHKIKCVYLPRREIRADDFYHGPLESQGTQYVPLCRSTGWSDQCHVTTPAYYKEFVLPLCKGGFMESTLHPLLKKAWAEEGMRGWEPFGTYLYGDIGDGPYMMHTDARNH